MYLSSVSASKTPPWPGLGSYAVSKAALDKLVEAWRAEHPHLGFTRVIVGECAGGEGDSMTGFAADWDRTRPATSSAPGSALPDPGALMDVYELINTIDVVARQHRLHRRVTVMPRRPNPG